MLYRKNNEFHCDLRNDLNLKFKNFTPSKEDYEKVYKKLQLILEKSPSQSMINATIEKRKSSFVANVEVKSFFETFTSKNATHSLMQLIILIEQELEKKISKWQGMRFNKKIIKNQVKQIH